MRTNSMGQESHFKRLVGANTENELLKRTLLDRLHQAGIRLDPDRKDQHLLISSEAIANLVVGAEVLGNETVLEIGPGPGQITEAIAQTARRVICIEVDRSFAPVLSALQDRYGNVSVIYGSALDVEWPRVDKVIANPPFSLLEPLIEKLVHEKKISSATIVIGEKYYQRCSAGAEDMTRTALVTQAFFEVKLIARLDGECFFPQSRERSVIMKLIRKDKKKANESLRVLVSRMINKPHESVSSVLYDLINGMVDVRRMDLQRIPTVASLHLSAAMLRKRLQDLDNRDLELLTQKIILLQQRFRS